jgi:hypothetical protein
VKPLSPRPAAKNSMMVPRVAKPGTAGGSAGAIFEHALEINGRGTFCSKAGLDAIPFTCTPCLHRTANPNTS